jgi:hypothetical protein
LGTLAPRFRRGFFFSGFRARCISSSHRTHPSPGAWGVYGPLPKCRIYPRAPNRFYASPTSSALRGVSRGVVRRDESGMTCGNTRHPRWRALGNSQCLVGAVPAALVRKPGTRAAPALRPED